MLDVAARTDQGPRPAMEDFVRVERPFAGHDDWVYGAVFDGHSGATVAQRASQRLHGLVAMELRAGRDPTEAVSTAFRTFDEEVAAEPCGATAAVVLLRGISLTVANVGDSHVLLASSGGVALLTTDHRLTNEAEYRRVVAAGARIWGPYACLPDGRGLMPTRALGDREFRQIGIVAEADVSTRGLRAGDAWIVVATDGVWDALDTGQVGALVRPASTADMAAERILKAALRLGSDNVSVVAIHRG